MGTGKRVGCIEQYSSSVITWSVGQYKRRLPICFLIFAFCYLQGIFIKDSNSLAYYNVTPASVVQLQLKERGGRKK